MCFQFHKQPYDFGDDDFFQALKKMWSASIQAEYRSLIQSIIDDWFLMCMSVPFYWPSSMLAIKVNNCDLVVEMKNLMVSVKKKKNNNKKQTPNLLKFSSIITLAWVMSLKNVPQ